MKPFQCLSLILIAVCLLHYGRAQEVSDLVAAIDQKWSSLDSGAFRCVLNTREFAKETSETREFDVFFCKGQGGGIYDYDWQITEYRHNGDVLTFMVIGSGYYSLLRSTRRLNYSTLLGPFEPGSYPWTLRSYFLPDEVLGPFLNSDEDVHVGNYCLTRPMREYATREVCVDSVTLMPLRMVMTIEEPSLEVTHTSEIIFAHDSAIVWSDSTLNPRYYLEKGYQLLTSEIVVGPNMSEDYSRLDLSTESIDVLKTYPLVNSVNDTLRIGELDGVAVLDFWYASCLPCMRAMPQVSQLTEIFSENNIHIVGVNCFDKEYRSEVSASLEKRGIDMKLVYGGRELVNRLGIRSYPTYLLMTDQGDVEYYGHHADVLKRLREIFDQ